jgi:hypothetical protein
MLLWRTLRIACPWPFGIREATAHRSLLAGGLMTAEAKSWLDVFEKSYQFYVYLFTIFVICMGIARWRGRQVWRKRELARRESNGLPVAAFSSGGAEQGFTYAGLFQGGLNGVSGLAALLLGAMVAWAVREAIAAYGPPVPRDFRDDVVMFMLVIIFMLAIGILAAIHSDRTRVAVRNSILLIGIVVVSVVAAAAAARLTTDKGVVIIIQFPIVAILSLCLSYYTGMTDGISSADPASNYPLVSVELNQGASFGQAWLYERTDSDYRLVTKDGTNLIIPAVNVKKIRKL